ncbi:MAG: hypothetical protein UV78_C0014G0010 [Parcubacteria group bacterium GW2011_GWA2_43_17]|nr:MAG: hypothetical protein UV78_C0014G0010 [Parcubacteria group bacterium GW2011_GWA2_43_17]KKT92512.1 MAG: hypothetical protein UW91_C0020G0006 [Parcubacteria group bacterium GW2011_GWF2_45_11]
MSKTRPLIDDKKAKIGKSSLFKKTDEGLFVVNLKTGLYYTINGSGEHIWLAIKKGKKPRQIVKDLAKRFRIKIEKAEREVVSYLEKLEKEKLIIRCR